MNKAESLKRQIDVLPPAMLSKVDRFVKSLKKQVRKPGKKVSLLSELAECAFDDDLPTDLAEQHDHYLYGALRK